MQTEKMRMGALFRECMGTLSQTYCIKAVHVMKHLNLSTFLYMVAMT